MWLLTQRSPLVLCVQDTWRTVTVDDRIPLDLFGGFWVGAGQHSYAVCSMNGLLILLLLLS